MPTESLTINETKETFFSLKINKRLGCDEISFNVIKNCISELNMPLKYLFEMSLEYGIFFNKLKIARVILLFKAESCFSKMLEQIMHNRFYKYLTTGKVLYPKQFAIQQNRQL